MFGRVLVLTSVIAVAAATPGCARLNNLNWSLEAVDVEEISETEYALEIAGNGFSTQADLQARADVEAVKLCGERGYKFRDESGETYEDWSSFSTTSVVVNKPVLNITVLCDEAAPEAEAEAEAEAGAESATEET